MNAATKNELKSLFDDLWNTHLSFKHNHQQIAYERNRISRVKIDVCQWAFLIGLVAATDLIDSDPFPLNEIVQIGLRLLHLDQGLAPTVSFVFAQGLVTAVSLYSAFRAIQKIKEVNAAQKAIDRCRQDNFELMHAGHCIRGDWTYQISKFNQELN